MFTDNKLNLVDHLTRVVLPEPDFFSVLQPKEVRHFSIESSMMYGLELLAPLKCKFGMKIAKKGSNLFISEGKSYLIAKPAGESFITYPFKLEHESDLEHLVAELKDGAIVGAEMPKKQIRVIFTGEDAEHIELESDLETGWLELMALYLRDLLRSVVPYSFTNTLPYGAFFDVNAQIPTFGEGEDGFMDAAEFFRQSMAEIFPHIEAYIERLVAKDPYRFYMVDTNARGVSIIQYGDIRVMLYERQRENEKLMQELDN